MIQFIVGHPNRKIGMCEDIEMIESNSSYDAEKIYEEKNNKKGKCVAIIQNSEVKIQIDLHENNKTLENEFEKFRYSFEDKYGEKIKLFSNCINEKFDKSTEDYVCLEINNEIVSFGDYELDCLIDSLKDLLL